CAIRGIYYYGSSYFDYW
nr:immunoglobulin heavy chain junction region [Mus musculus]MBK4187879.1 immunoglobulin heavy chain junction region [Mus musculus]MBK4187880.1 immunoglobulin heavy chain junction region [Mus musculus]MBK4187885.1 immunoglobulin heavy chain junction region [Mus musculus]MBK4187886.1 immunoglobulin heavy chain junction region [Mus musculus]